MSTNDHADKAITGDWPQPHMTGGETKLEMRYERLRRTCLQYGNLHPDDKSPCQQSMKLSSTPPIHMAAFELLDDMALCIKSYIRSAAPDTAARLREVESDLALSEKHRMELVDDSTWLRSERDAANARATAAEQERDRLNEERTKDINGLIDCAGRLAAVEAQRDGLLKAAKGVFEFALVEQTFVGRAKLDALKDAIALCAKEMG